LSKNNESDTRQSKISHGPKPSRYSEHNIEIMNSRQNPSRPKDPNLSDHDRPLEELGKDDALCMGKLISRDKKRSSPRFDYKLKWYNFLN
jgi:hypothetical protein